MIDYKALAGRIEAMARSYEDRSRLARTTQEDGTSERHSECAADLRTVVSLLEGMAEAEPIYAYEWDAYDGAVRRSFSPAPYNGVAPHRTLLLYPCQVVVMAHPAPQPNPAMLESHRRWVEQAVHDAEHPSGMSTHDGKARIDASVLRRMLAIIDAPQPQPERQPVSGPGTIPMPQTADEAQAMANISVAWLRDNAPDRLRQTEPTEAQIEAAEAKPVAWMDEFGNAFPLDAWKPAKRTYLDDHKNGWKPLFTHPAPQLHPDPFPDEPEWEAPIEPTEAQIKGGTDELIRFLGWDDEKIRAAGERIVRAALAAKEST